MNIVPVQNNNSQSFGMAFKLKGDGAKKLATVLDEISPDYASRFEKSVLDKIHTSKTPVIYDGENVIIHTSKGVVYNRPCSGEEFMHLIVSDKIPVAIPNTNDKLLQYIANEGNVQHIFKINYDKPQKYMNVAGGVITGHPLMQKLFNAKEILKVLDANAAKQAYEAEQLAAKQARIDEKAKKLSELYS